MPRRVTIINQANWADSSHRVDLEVSRGRNGKGASKVKPAPMDPPHLFPFPSYRAELPSTYSLPYFSFKHVTSIFLRRSRLRLQA